MISAMNNMNGNRDTDMTIPEYQASGLSGPAKVGSELRGVRERLGWKLPDLAARLKIRLPFLEAIEAGDLAALPAPAYAAGFIRSYAETMGLDPDEILRRFRAEGMTKPKQPHLTFPEPVPDRAVPPGAVVFLVAVIGIGAYFLWYRHSEHELKMAQMVPAIPAKLAPLAVPKQPAPVAKPVSKPNAAASSRTVTPGQSPAGGTVSSVGTTTTTPDTVVTTAGGNGSAATNSPPSPAGTAAAVAGAQPAATGAGNAGATPPASAAPAGAAPSAASTASNQTQASPLVISATADSWVQVQGPTGTILFSRVLKAGETWPVPDEPGLTLTTGNAGGTVLIHNGVSGSPLGNAGSVMRKVPLTPAAAAPTSSTSSTPAPAGTSQPTPQVPKPAP
jgi:cytoskeleton protein RodZ